MIRLYIPEPLPALPLALWFIPLPENMTYTENLPPNFFEKEVERVEDVRNARAIVLPNNFRESPRPEDAAYVKKYADLGERAGKPVVAFSLGDLTDGVVLDPRVHVFRFSLYKHVAGPRDVAVPNLTADDAQDGITLRAKRERPLVSFCGLAALPTLRGRLKYVVRNLWFEMQAIFAPHIRAKKLGIYWRRASMRACERSSLVDTRFIVRRTFSGNRKTIELDPSRARAEYLDSIINSDFVLASKGDGNYSNRFLEALSLGRIPVVVDTDIMLPLEDIIDYSAIMVRVPMSRVRETPALIRAFYDALSEEEWRARQKLARETFETYLRQDSFLRHFFTMTLLTLG